MSLASALDRIDAALPASLERLFAFVRLKSISADPAYADEVRMAGTWCVAELEGLGFEASLRETPGHPMVVAHWTGPVADEARHVLFYGHYDVQPVDPLHLWRSDPFDPKIEVQDGVKVIVGRGAADDKGQTLTFIEAVRALLAEDGRLPVRVTVLLEGEEESGSPSLEPFLAAHKDELARDVALVCDTNMWARRRPAITASLRGLVGEEVTIACADRDLHSGLFGGPAWNPIRLLTHVLADLHDADGRVTLPGFYDGVGDLPDEVWKSWEALGTTEATFLAPVGLKTPAGEVGRSILEQVWARPTCEFNGILGGYTGDGFKTVLPATASAKVSFRLVVGQDPAKIREAFRAHVRDRLPPDATASFHPHGGSPGLALPWDSPWLKVGLTALEAEWGVPAVVIGGGGSIPVVGSFERILGMRSLLVGFGLDDDRIHSPNEKYDLESFHKGIRSWARILTALAE
ncbi:M20/M25/M40 family metallo-hydrolase [Siculibacillus lacustris]|uniref:M20/M25/M40 family metallo-hydrolase n=1 Tax=Siculibacillus lacustris TaxID=1549641 RepID=A0A4Q9VXA9_9HYPH|nr:M20/M25/M40 family metallo-hydrolase [Siculibacillus lacustris]TBW41018.1 M20/M25/M40 family metallo-hydrolase [Siculibacillus lacustris]